MAEFFYNHGHWSTKLDKPFQTLMIVLGNILEGFNILKNVAEFKIWGSLGLFMGFVYFWLGFFWFFLVFVDLVFIKLILKLSAFSNCLMPHFFKYWPLNVKIELRRKLCVFTALESTLRKKV